MQDLNLGMSAYQGCPG